MAKATDAEALANAPEVSRQRAEPGFATAWAPAQAMADAGPRWHPDPFERPTAEEFAQSQQSSPEPLEPSVQHEIAASETPAEESGHLAQQPVAELAEAAPDMPHEPVAPEETAQPVPSAQAATDMAPPLDPAGAVAAMAMRDQINPPPPAE